MGIRKNTNDEYDHNNNWKNMEFIIKGCPNMSSSHLQYKGYPSKTMIVTTHGQS